MINECIQKNRCEKIEPQDNLGEFFKLTNQIWCKTGKKPSIERQITHTM